MKSTHSIGDAIRIVASRYNVHYEIAEATAWSRLATLYLSYILYNSNLAELRAQQNFLRNNYGVFRINCQWYKEITDYLREDNGEISLYIPNVESIETLTSIQEKEIIESLDFCRDGF